MSDELAEAQSKLRTILGRLPGAAQTATQVVIDNPGSCAVLFCAGFLAPRVALRVVRPRTLAEGLALAVLLEFGLSWAAARLISSGVIPVKVRDHHGCLHLIGDLGPDA